MTLGLYPDIVLQQDLSPDAFGSKIDDICNEIYDACKGWGANKKRVVEALGNTTPEDRYKICLRYRQLYSDDKYPELEKLMKAEFKGDLELALRCLSLPADEAEALMIKKATDGIGASKNSIYPIICGRTNEEMEMLKKVYFKKYTKDLGKLLSSELRGHFEGIVFNCLQASVEPYDPDFHDQDLVESDATVIYEAGQGRWGTNEKGLFKILCARPKEHLEKVNRYYADKYGYTLLKVLEKELSGSVQKASLFMLGMKMKPYETVAKLFDQACRGFGTDEMLLTTCVVRYQHVLKEVMMAHIELYGESIQDRIRSETSGAYRDLLLAVVETAWPSS